MDWLAEGGRATLQDGTQPGEQGRDGGPEETQGNSEVRDNPPCDGILRCGGSREFDGCWPWRRLGGAVEHLWLFAAIEVFDEIGGWIWRGDNSKRKLRWRSLRRASGDVILGAKTFYPG